MASRLSRALLGSGGTAAGLLLLWQQQSGGGGVALAQPVPTADRLARWSKRWEDGVTRWHLPKPHPLLKKYDAELLGPAEERSAQCVLFPLCGSSVDLAYLARRGHDVVGVEGVPLAVDALLGEWGEELTVSGQCTEVGALSVRVAKAAWFQKVAAEQTGLAERGSPYILADLLRAVQGDFLQLTPEVMARFGLGQFEPARRATNGTFDAAFDRGGLVAVEPVDRQQYADVLSSLMAPGGRILLVAVEHEPAFGPPHSLTHEQVNKLFADNFHVRLLQREDRMEAEPAWKERGASSFEEIAYLLVKK